MHALAQCPLQYEPFVILRASLNFRGPASLAEPREFESSLTWGPGGPSLSQSLHSKQIGALCDLVVTGASSGPVGTPYNLLLPFLDWADPLDLVGPQ